MPTPSEPDQLPGGHRRSIDAARARPEVARLGAVGGPYVGPAPPDAPGDGDLWWDTDDDTPPAGGGGGSEPQVRIAASPITTFGNDPSGLYPYGAGNNVPDWFVPAWGWNEGPFELGSGDEGDFWEVFAPVDGLYEMILTLYVKEHPDHPGLTGVRWILEDPSDSCDFFTDHSDRSGMSNISVTNVSFVRPLLAGDRVRSTVAGVEGASAFALPGANDPALSWFQVIRQGPLPAGWTGF